MESIIYSIFKIDIYPESLLDIGGEVFGFVEELLLILDKELMEFILTIRELLRRYNFDISSGDHWIDIDDRDKNDDENRDIFVLYPQYLSKLFHFPLSFIPDDLRDRIDRFIDRNRSQIIWI
jgi:hypothetical protein